MDSASPLFTSGGIAVNRKVRVAIIGVGNCASSLVQGVEFYKNTSDEQHIPGLMHTNLGGYRTGITESQLKGAPKYGNDNTWNWADPARTRAVNDYYGIAI